MNCSECRSRMEAYVDAELSPSDMEAFRVHVEECAGCAAAALRLSESKSALRKAGNRYAAPAEFRARVFDFAKNAVEAKNSQAERSSKRLPRFDANVWLRWGLAAAALALVAIGLFFVSRRQESKTLAEFADLHVVALASANPVEIISTDRHTVKPWFQGRLPFTFDLPDLQGSPFILVGGRMVYFHQEPGAHLIFGYQRHFISVFIFRDTGQLALPASSLLDQGTSFRLQTWTQGSLRYVVIGDAGTGTIQQLSALLRNTH